MIPETTEACTRARDRLLTALADEKAYAGLFAAAAAAARGRGMAANRTLDITTTGDPQQAETLRRLKTGSHTVGSQCAIRRCIIDDEWKVTRRRFEIDPLATVGEIGGREEAHTLGRAARFTDSLGLATYAGMLRYVPKLVNVVTLVRVEPIPGSDTCLPLPLERIARRCVGAFFSPRRFAAVQLAFRSPRCRILIFHTGKLVGTGCGSITEARLAILYACEKMSREAGVHVRIAGFDVMNTVGATAMRTTIDCTAFARAHSSEAMFDKSSFVGLTWRPRGEPICVEVYGTGRANLPGACTYTALLHSFARLVAELLRFSSSSTGCVAESGQVDEDLSEEKDDGLGTALLASSGGDQGDIEHGAEDSRLTRKRQRQAGVMISIYQPLGGRPGATMVDNDDGSRVSPKAPEGIEDDAWLGWGAAVDGL